MPEISGEEKIQASKTVFPKSVLVIIFLGLAAIIISALAVPRLLVYLTRAAKPTNFSLTNSYVFGSPLVANADGKEKITINVFLLDKNGKGVAKKQVVTSALAKEGTNGNVEIEDVKPISDDFGKAVFEVTSKFPGQFVISAVAATLELPQTVTVTFR